MAGIEPAIVKILNKSTGVVWEVAEGSPTYTRCLALADQYEITQDEKPAPKRRKIDG